MQCRDDLRRKTPVTLAALIERQDTEIAALKQIIASQAAVIIRQGQEIERRIEAETAHDV